MAGKHSINNKLLDVKKALSKTEMTKLSNKNQNHENSNSRKTSDWNSRGSGDPGHNNGWSGQRGPGGTPMNMGPNMGVPGYGPAPAWGEFVWIDFIQ